ncbi:hypothetical protein COCON_G00145190 [Conger conger]|uniref:Uncharacterized protein n=1 Tax=Conger conger TaxID=82655 RepID=A0A9Q1DBL8_CONCO|nr:hypothetical protein COCON_G00145190 [Conger conger]
MSFTLTTTLQAAHNDVYILYQRKQLPMDGIFRQIICAECCGMPTGPVMFWKLPAIKAGGSAAERMTSGEGSAVERR